MPNDYVNWYWPNDVRHWGPTRPQKVNCITSDPLSLYPVRFLVATTHLEIQRPQTVNSGSELHGYLTTWEGTRIVGPVTSWHWCPYSDVIMSAMAYYITSLTIVHSTVYSGADKSPASLAFVRGIHRWPVNSPHKGRASNEEKFSFDDVIMATRLIGFRYVCHRWFSSKMLCELKPILRKLYGKQLIFVMPSRFLKMKMHQKYR